MPPAKTEKPKNTTPKVTISKWYKADDVAVHYRRRQKKPVAAPLRKNLVPGQILIILSGRFRGKRVVFLKQLKSGLLLVTGPFKVNGVPLKRVNQAYVIVTKTVASLNGVKVDDINDEYFGKTKVKKAKKSEESFFATNLELSPEAKAKEAERKKEKVARQSVLDKALLENVKKVPFLKKYLAARFTLTNNLKPHDLVF